MAAMAIGGAAFGILACAAMTGSAICCAVPVPPVAMAHGQHKVPIPDHQDMPMGCHAVLGCSGSRKLRAPS